MKRAAAPGPGMTDLCTCGDDFGSHDGRGRCGRCACKRFTPVTVRPGVRTPAALYLRVSTREQTVDNQRPDLEDLARRRGLHVVRVYEEQVSAAASSRPAFEAMLSDAHRGRFGVILVWALDRFGRSLGGNVQAVIELDRRGVQVVSFREPWLDTGGPVRGLLVAIFSWVAEQERAQLVARTKAGIEHARRKGVRLGRPPARFDVVRARSLRERGLSLRLIAAELGVPRSVLERGLKPAKGE